MSEPKKTAVCQPDRVLAPAYYYKFHCAAKNCRDSCCQYPWRVPFCKKDYLKVKQAPKPPELEARVKQSMRRIRGVQESETYYAEFDMKNGGCGLLQDGLCSLQLACGYQCLPEVCRVFPRGHGADQQGKTLFLSPGCEAVLQLL